MLFGIEEHFISLRQFAVSLIIESRITRLYTTFEEAKNEITIKETSEKWGLSPRRIQTLCTNDRIDGATCIGYMWVIPEDAVKPKDARIKSGKYIKK